MRQGWQIAFSGSRRRITSRSHATAGVLEAPMARHSPLSSPSAAGRPLRLQFVVAVAKGAPREGLPSIYAWCPSQTAICTTTHLVCTADIEDNPSTEIPSFGNAPLPVVLSCACNATRYCSELRVNDGSLISSGTLLDSLISHSAQIYNQSTTNIFVVLDNTLHLSL